LGKVRRISFFNLSKTKEKESPSVDGNGDMREEKKNVGMHAFTGKKNEIKVGLHGKDNRREKGQTKKRTQSQTGMKDMEDKEGN